MQEPKGLDYVPESLLGPLSRERVAEFEAWLARSGEKITFDDSYIDHLANWHGGVPRIRYFAASTGRVYEIERFFNFLDSKSNSPLRRYRVNVIWSTYDDRLGPNLMPFAELTSGDKLCFDYEKSGRPTVVIWYPESSLPDEPPVTLFIAKDFDRFLSLLSETRPKGI